MHQVVEVDFWSLEPLPRGNEPPNRDQHHRSSIHNHCPIHICSSQITSRHAWQTQDGYHERNEGARNDTDWDAESPEIPRSRAESIANEEDADEDGRCESNEGGAGSNAEECADGQGAAEDKQQHEATKSCVHPDGVDRCLGVWIHLLPYGGEWEAVVACVGECHSRSGYHASLSHEEASDNCEGQDCQDGFLGENLDEVGSERLA